METRTPARNEIEWTGVSEVVDRTRNALYRANATTFVLAAFLIITFTLIYLDGDGDGNMLSTIAAFALLLPAVWILSFSVGYVGNSWAPGYTNAL